jgi:hypothetical protein
VAEWFIISLPAMKVRYIMTRSILRSDMQSNILGVSISISFSE